MHYKVYTMRVCHKLSVFGIICAIFSGLLSGCTTTHISKTLAPSDASQPYGNPFPKHIVTIHGAVSKSLNIKLSAYYITTNPSPACQSTPTYTAGAIEGAIFPSQVSVPLTISRSGNKFSAQFIVDYFLPGLCEWRFSDVSAEVSKNSLVSIPNRVIINIPKKKTNPFGNPNTGIFHITDNSPSSKETWGYNSRNTPVVWRCRFSRLVHLRNGDRRFACDEDVEKHKSKYQQLLNSTTNSVEVDFIDLESQ